MRGHVLVEFQSTPPAYYRQYRCQRCNEVLTCIQNAPGPILSGNRCPKPGCGDKLFSPGRLGVVPVRRMYYVCNADPTHRFDSATGVCKGDKCPTCGPPAKLAPERVWLERYKCGSCNYVADFTEPGAPVQHGSHQDEVCPCGCGGRMRSIAVRLVHGDRIEFLASEPGKLMDNKIGGVPVPGLPAPSIGHPVGVAFSFLGDTDLWGHEMGHCRYFEHAASAPGRKPEQHDSAANSVVNWGIRWSARPPIPIRTGIARAS